MADKKIIKRLLGSPDKMSNKERISTINNVIECLEEWIGEDEAYQKRVYEYNVRINTLASFCKKGGSAYELTETLLKKYRETQYGSLHDHMQETLHDLYESGYIDSKDHDFSLATLTDILVMEEATSFSIDKAIPYLEKINPEYEAKINALLNASLKKLEKVEPEIYEIIYIKYIQEKKLCREEISKKAGCSERTVTARTIKGIEELSKYLFGDFAEGLAIEESDK